MNNSHLCIALAVVFLLTACKENHQSDNRGKMEKHTKEEKHHSSHSANEHMHQKSVEEMARAFESQERDAYQKPHVVLDYLGDIKGKMIMDIGAGSGYFSVKLAEQGAQVIAADISEEFQSILQKRIEENKVQNIALRKIPYDSPSLTKNEVDIVLIVNTYHHIEKRSEYFTKVKAGTKPSGELVLIDFFKTEVPVGPPVKHKIAIDQVIAELKEAGYSRFEVNVDLLPYQYIIRAK